MSHITCYFSAEDARALTEAPKELDPIATIQLHQALEQIKAKASDGFYFTELLAYYTSEQTGQWTYASSVIKELRQQDYEADYTNHADRKNITVSWKRQQKDTTQDILQLKDAVNQLWDAPGMPGYCFTKKEFEALRQSSYCAASAQLSAKQR
jgi:hypothetical protein